MSINAAFASGMHYVSAAVRGTAVAAKEIASTSMPRSKRGEGIKRVRGVEDLASAIIDLKTCEYQEQGGVAVIKDAYEMAGTVTDELV